MGNEVKNLKNKVDWGKFSKIIYWTSGVNFLVLFFLYFFVLFVQDKIGYSFVYWLFSFIYIPLTSIIGLIVGLVKIKKVGVSLLILLINLFIGFLLFNIVLKLVHWLEKLF